VQSYITPYVGELRKGTSSAIMLIEEISLTWELAVENHYSLEDERKA